MTARKKTAPAPEKVEEPPEKTTQDQLAETGHEYGWRVIPRSDTAVRFKRLGWIVDVDYSRVGNITQARRDRVGTDMIDRLDRTDKDKYSTVDKWLRKQ